MTNNNLDNDYCAIKDKLFFVHIGLTFFYFFIMAYSFSFSLSEMVKFMTGNAVIGISIYFLFFYLLYSIFTFGLKYYQDFVLKKNFDLKIPLFSEWLQSLAKKEIAWFFAFLFIVQVIYGLMEYECSFWWIFAGLFWLSFCPGMLKLYFAYIYPLFCQYRRIQNTELDQKLISLAQKMNIKVSGVYLNKFQGLDRKTKVIFIGIKNKGKFILSKELENYSVSEVEVLAARELAHYSYAHYWKLLALNAGVVFLLSFLVSSIFNHSIKSFDFVLDFDIASLPVLSGIFLTAILTALPFLNTYARGIELKADKLCLKFTKLPDAFVSVLIRSEHDYCSNYFPAKFIEVMLYNYPSISERIYLAEKYAQDLLFKTYHNSAENVEKK